MHGLSADHDFTFLIGLQLDAITMRAHTVRLQFDATDDVHLNVEGDVRLREHPQGVVRELTDAVATGIAAAFLLGQAVVAATGSVDGTLTLVWNGGATMQILDSSSEFESYQVHNGSQVTAV